MNFKELFEGATPKLPGAFGGVKIMTPQQFVAKHAEQIDEANFDSKFGVPTSSQGVQMFQNQPQAQRMAAIKAAKAAGYTMDNQTGVFTPPQQQAARPAIPAAPQPTTGKVINFDGTYKVPLTPSAAKGWKVGLSSAEVKQRTDTALKAGYTIDDETGVFIPPGGKKPAAPAPVAQKPAAPATQQPVAQKPASSYADKFGVIDNDEDKADLEYSNAILRKAAAAGDKNAAKALEIRKMQGLAEATKLAAPTRLIGDPELTDYLDRIRSQQKKKTDKYKLPYIHRSSVVGYYDEAGKKYNVDAIKNALKERPKALLKKNEKMKHSDGTDEQFFNIGFAALVGIALDENTNELIVVNTCPGAGSCKVDCFAMKGGKVQFQGPWLSDGRILTYLLNDPDGFFNRLKEEISKEEAKGKKGGYKVSIRWHDAGDFFSPEYAAMAFKLAEELPNVDFYAYTKVADVALGNKPDNFMINWSEGASSSQEKKVKGADPSLEKTKNSRIIPSNLFYDLLVKDEKKNLVKGPEGQWQVIPSKLPELKQRLAKEYGLSANSILSYNEWESKVKGKDKSPLKYNVIIAPGEPDLTAKDAGVLSTLLLKH